MGDREISDEESELVEKKYLCQYCGRHDKKWFLSENRSTCKRCKSLRAKINIGTADLDNNLVKQIMAKMDRGKIKKVIEIRKLRQVEEDSEEESEEEVEKIEEEQLERLMEIMMKRIEKMENVEKSMEVMKRKIVKLEEENSTMKSKIEQLETHMINYEIGGKELKEKIKEEIKEYKGEWKKEIVIIREKMGGIEIDIETKLGEVEKRIIEIKNTEENIKKVKSNIRGVKKNVGEIEGEVKEVKEKVEELTDEVVKIRKKCIVSPRRKQQSDSEEEEGDEGGYEVWGRGDREIEKNIIAKVQGYIKERVRGYTNLFDRFMREKPKSPVLGRLVSGKYSVRNFTALLNRYGIYQ